MSRRARAAGSAGAAAALLLLTACGGGGGGADAAEVEPADFEGLELTMWSGVPYDPFMTVNQEQLTRCADEIGASVTAESFPNDQFVTKVLQAGSAGELPDLLMVSSGNLGQYAEGGLLTDLEELGLSTERLDENTARMGYIDDTLVGIASHVETAALQYNPDVLAEAGVEVPTTFDELREVAAALTTEDRYGIALPGKADDGSASFFFLSFILGAGGDPADFEDPGTIAAVQLYKDLVEDGSMSPEMVNWGWDFQDQFNGGRAAMTINGPWASQADEGTPPRAFAPTPVTDGNEWASGITALEWTIPVSDDPVAMAAAAEILECRLAAENQVEMAEAQAYIPANAEAAEEWTASNPAIAPFVEAMPTAYDQSAAFGEEWFAVGNQLAAAIQYAVVGGMSAEDALARAASE